MAKRTALSFKNSQLEASAFAALTRRKNGIKNVANPKPRSKFLSKGVKYDYS
jgi:hypothetical protein